MPGRLPARQRSDGQGQLGGVRESLGENGLPNAGRSVQDQTVIDLRPLDLTSSPSLQVVQRPPGPIDRRIEPVQVFERQDRAELGTAPGL